MYFDTLHLSVYFKFYTAVKDASFDIRLDMASECLSLFKIISILFYRMQASAKDRSTRIFVFHVIFNIKIRV